MADRFTQQFIVCNRYIRERLDTIGAQQARLGAIFFTFTIEFANLILPRPFFPLVNPRHGTALGRTFIIYHHLQRAERRIRDLRHALAEYLVDYSELCEEHLNQTLLAVQLTDHQIDSLVLQYQALEATVRLVEDAIRENREARRQLWFFPL